MIVVTGAGSMGSMFGGLMSRAGHDVTLVDVNADHMAAVAQSGLTLQFPDGRTEVVRPGATTDPSTLRDVSLVVVNAADYQPMFVEVHARGAFAKGATEEQLVEACVCAIPHAGVAAWLPASIGIIAGRPAK